MVGTRSSRERVAIRGALEERERTNSHYYAKVATRTRNNLEPKWRLDFRTLPLGGQLVLPFKGPFKGAPCMLKGSTAAEGIASGL